jgi:hypothetical protein
MGGILVVLLLRPLWVFANPASNTYQLETYSFGAGGIASSSSNSYSLEGLLGQIESSKSASGTYSAQSGIMYQLEANTPGVPVLDNPDNTYYDRLHLTIDTNGNTADVLYAVAITDDNWITTQYVKSDLTLGSSLDDPDWLPYSGGSNNWGGSSGAIIRTLQPSTTYKVKVKAKNDFFTPTDYSPEASGTTAAPILSFGISSSSLVFDHLNAGNGLTDSSKFTTLTTSTNAYNGYVIYTHETDRLMANSGSFIPDYGSPNSLPSVWSGTGFGYTTSDTNLVGGSTNRFVGPKYAGFTTAIPGDPVADHSAVDGLPVTNEQYTISYRVTAEDSLPAGTYSNTVNYVVVPQY